MIGHEIIHLERVDSTSNYIATLHKEGKVGHGMVILADEQTNGRGQRGAKWQSEAKQNLLFSFYIEYTNLPIDKQEAITHFVSLSIQQAIQTYSIKAVIKWPNDILVNSKKIAGILIENQLRGTNIQSSIIGIGLNILQTHFDDDRSTSLVLENANQTSINSFLNTLLSKLNNYFQLLNKQGYKELKKEYLKALWLLNVPVEFEDQNGLFQGIIKGTDEYGRLMIERESKIHIYNLKEVSFIARNG
jgi:BirA family biotin operon repressor/biotin-[acetyl-CoA-carboxylase] ligase